MAPFFEFNRRFGISGLRGFQEFQKFQGFKGFKSSKDLKCFKGFKWFQKFQCHYEKALPSNKGLNGLKSLMGLKELKFFKNSLSAPINFTLHFYYSIFTNPKALCTQHSSLSTQHQALYPRIVSRKLFTALCDTFSCLKCSTASFFSSSVARYTFRILSRCIFI